MLSGIILFVSILLIGYGFPSILYAVKTSAKINREIQSALQEEAEPVSESVSFELCLHVHFLEYNKRASTILLWSGIGAVLVGVVGIFWFIYRLSI